MGMSPSQIVLIETYWNVNNLPCSTCMEHTFCINRNILECKSIPYIKAICRIAVLIETYWNVN